tara:strand:- start:73 stop:288 length:216 start_codon:yes stop_codon:yes gene_type:complete
MKETYYKFKVTDLENDKENYFYQFKDLYNEIKIPRSTFYKVLDGNTSSKSKFLNKYKFERCKLPRHQLVTY